MNDLLFYTILIALLYYFFIYLPAQKKLSSSTQPSPIFDTKATQTEELMGEIYQQAVENLRKDIAQKEQTITSLNNSYEKLEQKKEKQITELQTQIRDLVKRPLKPTNSKSIQTDSEENLTEVIDTLIKNIQELNNSL